MTLGRETQEIGQGSSLFLISVMCSGFRAAVFFAPARPAAPRGRRGRGTTLRKKLNAAQIREFLKIYAQ